MRKVMLAVEPVWVMVCQSWPGRMMPEWAVLSIMLLSAVGKDKGQGLDSWHQLHSVLCS